MEAVYYFDDYLKLCPVKRYLGQYILDTKDKPKVCKFKLSVMADIRAKIEYVTSQEGRPTPPISKKLTEYSFFEIRARKNKDILIRITYFRHENKIVLLTAFEKPNNYDKNKGVSIIEKEFAEAEVYRKRFISKPKNYEKFQ